MAKNCFLKKSVNKQLCDINYGQVVKGWLTADDTGLPFADFLVKSNIIDKITAGIDTGFFPIFSKGVSNVTVNNEEQVIDTGNTGIRTKIRDGKKDMMFEMKNINYAFAKQIKEFDGSNLFWYSLTKEGYIAGASDGTNLKPVPVLVTVTDLVMPDSEDNTQSLMVHIFFTNNTGNFDYFIDVAGDGDYNPLNIFGLTPLAGEFVSASAAGSTVVVNFTDKLNVGKEIFDFVTAGDFVIEEKSTGTTQDASAVTFTGATTTLTATVVDATEYLLYRKPIESATDKVYVLPREEAIEFTAGA
jgi:hypothetical protein